ncbi:MAG: ATPase [Candidatus Bathyarchaeota archaeon B23]|nr:MAG: ATPase [Candidatus Bathyarchaeota archaeon B23]
MRELPWHSVDVEEILAALETRREGLSEEEARRRLEEYGLNELREERRVTPLQLFLGQFKSILVVILVISALVSAYISMRKGEPYTDTYVIMAIVILNALLGFYQEYRAEKAVEALKRMIAPKAAVVREDQERLIDSREIVPGDIILLEAGNRVPADGRLLEAYSLQVDEAPLTGESTPVQKRVCTLEEEVPVPDRSNMVYMGTLITGGRGVAVVTSTGMRTEFGRIAEMVQTIEVGEPPLKKKMEKMGRQLAIISVVLCIWVFLIGLFIHWLDFETLFMTSVSLAVSAIPEGLPAVLTITLALGVSRMAREKAIVRRLASVETLGSTTVICSDKTGTLTKNEMTVRRIALPGRIIEVTGAGYIPEGEFLEEEDPIDPLKDGDLELLLRIGVLCSDAHLREGEGGWSIFGDPTEGALVVAAAKAGLWKEELERCYPRIGEVPFDSMRKRMTTIHQTPEGSRVAYVKGAPEVILERCTHILERGSRRRITDRDREWILSTTREMASEALRVLAMAYKELPAEMESFEAEEVERDLTFVGLQGMIDPPRDEVPEAIKLCRMAGVRPIMVTGDHRLTAVAIAKQIGMLSGGEEAVLTGVELDGMSDEELDEIIETVSVFARVSPEHKVRIAQSLRRKGHIVAMTGDGVNDAPALKAANIGVAMGIKGTDVTKEAADMILEDDNFATIVKAVESGRHIYDNITKYIRLMLTANFDEFIEITVCTLLGLPLPFLPIHVLWVNLVTDGLPAVALSVDPKDPDIMKYPPRNPEEGLLTRFWRFILFAAVLDFLSDFAPFLYVYTTTGDPVLARTVAFTSIVFFEFFLAYQCRSETHHLFAMDRRGWTENRMLFLSVVVSIAIQIAIIYWPPLQTVFHVKPLTPLQFALCVLGAFTAFLILPNKLIKARVFARPSSDS